MIVPITEKLAQVFLLQFLQSIPELFQKWTKVSEKKNQKPKTYLFCSAHFDLSCFEVGKGKNGCKPCNDAVPSIFLSFPKYYQNQIAKRKPPKTKVLTPSPSKVARTVVNKHFHASNQGKGSRKCETAGNEKLMFLSRNYIHK